MNQTNETNQINQTSEMNQINETNFHCWKGETE